MVVLSFGQWTQRPGRRPPDPAKAFRKVADRVLTVPRVQAMLERLRQRLSQSQVSHDSKVKHLTKELALVQQRSQHLYEAVEKGLLPMDSTLTERANKLQAQRQALLTDIAGLRRLKHMPLDALG